jgi:hypothetical protein
MFVQLAAAFGIEVGSIVDNAGALRLRYLGGYADVGSDAWERKGFVVSRE